MAHLVYFFSAQKMFLYISFSSGGVFHRDMALNDSTQSYLSKKSKIIKKTVFSKKEPKRETSKSKKCEILYAGHGSAEVRGHGDWDFQLRPRHLTNHHDIPRTITFSMSKHAKQDSDTIGTKYTQK